MIMARNWVVAMKIEGSGWLGLRYVLEVQPFNFKMVGMRKEKLRTSPWFLTWATIAQIIWYGWVWVSRQKPNKRLVEQAKEFCFAQVKFELTHLSKKEWINEWTHGLVHGKQVSVRIIAPGCFHPKFRIFTHYNITQRIFHQCLVSKFYRKTK